MASGGVQIFIAADRTIEAIMAKNRAVEAALEAIGLEAEKHAVEFIGGEKGHPRRVKTGNLWNSITHYVVKDEESVYVGTDVKYARAVHDGHGKVLPNRFLRDAVYDYLDDYKKIAEKALKY